MLSKPRIFYNSSSEVVKGQTIQISCQSINGTSPISYSLLKEGKLLERKYKDFNQPTVFKDQPTKDTEYQCIADNCHSHTNIVSKVLHVKVIGECQPGRSGPCDSFPKVWSCSGIVWTREDAGASAIS